MKKTFYLICFVFLFSSCADETIPVSKNRYFSLADFFKAEAARLQEQHIQLQKTITKDGITEQNIFRDVNWLETLKPFIECDINKPAWLNGYDIDTLRNYATTVTYEANDPKLPIRMIRITLSGTSPVNIYIVKERRNFYYGAKDVYLYDVTKGFEITGSQEVRFRNETKYDISAGFINP